jgi:hypothetical protein
MIILNKSAPVRERAAQRLPVPHHLNAVAVMGKHPAGARPPFLISAVNPASEFLNDLDVPWHHLYRAEASTAGLNRPTSLLLWREASFLENKKRILG